MTTKAIAIDGPAGAGKSTVARVVAAKLGYLYIDTGAMYRAVALKALRAGVAVDDKDALTSLAQKTEIELKNDDGAYYVFCDGEDISAAIRTVEVGAAASPVSAHLGVREALVAQQQRIAAANNVVMDGRDIGTKVVPDAFCKVFLTADIDERSRRRRQDLQNRGIEAELAAVKKEMQERDDRDSNRANSPLRQAADAVLIDSTDLTIDQVVERILSLVEERS